MTSIPRSHGAKYEESARGVGEPSRGAATCISLGRKPQERWLRGRFKPRRGEGRAARPVSPLRGLVRWFGPEPGAYAARLMHVAAPRLRELLPRFVKVGNYARCRKRSKTMGQTRWQFSLRTLLLVVTGWALMLSFWKAMPSPKLVYSPLYSLMTIGVFLTAAAVVDLFFRRRP